MGLIGWADAPNSIEEKKNELETQTPTASGFAAGSESLTPNEPTQSDSPLFGDDQTDTASAMDSEADAIDNGAAVEDAETPGFESHEHGTLDSGLLLAIRNLRLTGSEDENRYDISKFELHEIKFLFEHAERSGSIDYFAAVREVFGVKHRILDEKIDIDAVASPNLDELMAFVEEKYESSFGGDNL